MSTSLFRSRRVRALVVGGLVAASTVVGLTGTRLAHAANPELTWRGGGQEVRAHPAVVVGTPITIELDGCREAHQGIEVSKFTRSTGLWGFYPPITRAPATASFTLIPPLGESDAVFNCFDYSAQDKAIADAQAVNGPFPDPLPPTVFVNSIKMSFTAYREGQPLSSEYRPLSPARLLDTRATGSTFDARFEKGGLRAANSVLELDVTGRQDLVPADAKAVSLNVTVTSPSAGGYISVFPCGEAVPNSSNLNFDAGQTIPNAVTTKLGTSGRLCIFTSAATHLIVDLSGFFPAASTFVGSQPGRLLDTRQGTTTVDSLFAGIGTRTAGSTLELEVGGRYGLPATAKAVSLNVTVTGAQAGGYLTVYPCGAPLPDASNLNFSAGQTIANLVVTSLGTGGKVCLFTSSATEILVDSNGYLPATSPFVSKVPGRLMDSRAGGNTIDTAHQRKGAIGAGTMYRLPIIGRHGVPDQAIAAILNVTVVGAQQDGYITVYPCTATAPNASNLNYSAGSTIPNAVIAQISESGDVCLFASGTTDVIVDLSAYLAS